MTIKTATVLGAGNMGSQIAALLVNAGLQVRLLDVVLDPKDPNRLSREAFERITNPKKGLLYSSSFAPNLSYGNFDDDLASASASDLFIEAVAENPAIKHRLWERVARVARPEAILTTNTSGIPIREVAAILSEADKARFAGFHFFNPPRFMKLVELIPHETTSAETLTRLTDFATRVLGKGIVRASDVPGFVANRIGVYALVDVMYRAEAEALPPEEVDALTGTVIGRPKTATYRLNDLVGIDIVHEVARNMAALPAQKAYYRLPPSLSLMTEKGSLGNKTSQGYYRKEGREIQVYRKDTDSYTPEKPADIPLLGQLGRDLTKNFRTIFEQRKDGAARFLWQTLANIMHYAAINVPEATDDYRNIDRAMVWGYNWRLGPFQIWDAIGFDRVREDLRKLSGSLPAWIEARNEGFYGPGEDISPLKGLADHVEGSIWQHEGVSDLLVAANRKLILVMRSPHNTVTLEFAQDLRNAVEFLNRNDYRAMVVHAEGANFSPGANIGDMSRLIAEGQISAIARLVDAIQGATAALKYSAKPIVTAARGKALGGGAELLLHSPFVVAAAESVIGLVEIGVGVIPSGGGLTELATRIYAKHQERAEELAGLKKAFNQVIFARTSGNAWEAREMGYLRETDLIIQNEALILEAALQKADLEASFNYIPGTKSSLPVQGSNFRALALARLDSLVAGEFATEHERGIGAEVASTLAGGDVPLGTQLTPEHFLALEKAGFLKLCQTEKTLERMQHMLKTRQVLRN